MSGQFDRVCQLVASCLWRVACMTNWLTQCDDMTVWRVGRVTSWLWRVDYMTSWPCDELVMWRVDWIPSSLVETTLGSLTSQYKQRNGQHYRSFLSMICLHFNFKIPVGDTPWRPSRMHHDQSDLVCCIHSCQRLPFVPWFNPIRSVQLIDESTALTGITFIQNTRSSVRSFWSPLFTKMKLY